jgi:hypothetical protein
LRYDAGEVRVGVQGQYKFPVGETVQGGFVKLSLKNAGPEVPGAYPVGSDNPLISEAGFADVGVPGKPQDCTSPPTNLLTMCTLILAPMCTVLQIINNTSVYSFLAVVCFRLLLPISVALTRPANVLLPFFFFSQFAS